VLSRIRRMPSPALAISVIALIVAVGGGAFAVASSNSSVKKLATKIANKQITQRAAGLSVLHAGTADSATTATTADTATTAKTATIATRATNAANAEKATSAATADNASQLGGVAASHYVTAGSELASGDTEVGVYAASAPTPTAARTSVSFIPKLPGSVENSHFQELGVGAKSAQCPGARQAVPGFMCVYEGFDFETAFVNHGDPFSGAFGGEISPEGMTLVYATSDSESNVRGSWAYTAP
jgi:hypothetical protein